MAKPDAKRILKFLLKAADDPKVWEDYKNKKEKKDKKEYLKSHGLTDEDIDYCLGGGNTTMVAVDIPPQPPIVWQPPTVWQ